MAVEPEVIIVPHPGRRYHQFIQLKPFLDHLEAIYQEDPESHAGCALAALLTHHRRIALPAGEDDDKPALPQREGDYL